MLAVLGLIFWQLLLVVAFRVAELAVGEFLPPLREVLVGRARAGLALQPLHEVGEPL